MALFSTYHDATVSTTTRQGRAVSYKVSEHKVGTIFDGNGKVVTEVDLDMVSTEPLRCALCASEAPAVEAAAPIEKED